MGLISFLMGSDGRKSLKKLNKIADKVEALDGKYAAMDDAELKSQTELLKGRLAAGETLDDILPDAFAALREAAWRVLGMKHFHVQVIGGICLHQGRIAEMRTGDVARVSERAFGKERAYRHGERLSCEARCGVDGKSS